jgi:hypothetical protein
LQEPVGREFPLGLAFWGNAWEVETTEGLLEERMKNQRGEIFWLGEKNQDEFLDLLHEAAIRDWRRHAEKAKDAIDPSYQRLLKKIREIS